MASQGGSDDDLGALLARLSHLLPAQAPLEVFVHHNTLHAFQHLPFHEALAEAEERLGASGYLPEEAYRHALRSGRISQADLDDALERHLPLRQLRPWPAQLPGSLGLARLILERGIAPVSPAGLRWRLDELRAGERFAPGLPAAAREALLRAPPGQRREESAAVGQLWQACLALSARDLGEDHREQEQGPDAPASGVRPTAPWRSGSRVAPAKGEPLLPREAILQAGGEDPDDLVHPLLVLLAGAFLDRGQSGWAMPDREAGFFVAVRRILGAGHAVRPSWLATLGLRLRSWEARAVGALGAIEEMLDELDLGPARPALRAAFLESTLLRLPGWAGMFHRLEVSPLKTGRTAASASLADFVAVRLCLDSLALAEAGRRLGYRGPLHGLVAACATLPRLAKPEAEDAPAWPLFLLAQHAGLGPERLLSLPDREAGRLIDLVRLLDRKARLRVWQEAYEGHYREELLVALEARRSAPRRRPEARRQVILCIDDRSESLRRHFEELAPSHETFGAAGFFNLAIAYQGIDDPSTFPLCPVVVAPKHRIEEAPAGPEQAPLWELRKRRLRGAGLASASFRRASGSLLLAPLLTALAGVAAALPMLASVFAPLAAGRLRAAARGWWLPSPRTKLVPPRAGHDADMKLFEGFSVEEKAERVGSLLENIGLVRGFSRLVAILGHDSSSANNPHFAAYSCGACGGRSGGPNARLFARMANRPEVRALLRSRGIEIPEGCWWVGGVHDTCADRITFFDTEDLPDELREELQGLRGALAEACRRNAQERCRRFASAPASPSEEAAYRHVEGRSFDISQARPELGHATNASCLVGRRDLSRGLFLDRRAFLVSYDPTIDPSGEILERVLAAVGPVGAGINLEYFFSTVDNERLGAGTKLPHNVTGLIGVMNGASSDLRTGLPRQMVEVHEPVRLQLVVEAPPGKLEGILERQPGLRELVEGAWVRLVSVDPADGRVRIRAPGGGFEPWGPPKGRVVPLARRSADWFQGREGFLPPALILGDVLDAG